ncbi:MAG: acyl carrier protein [Deltaproteobacteria bacterium]|nr:acyl carrier protein [Deltaproteobacteria bacterium]
MTEYLGIVREFVVENFLYGDGDGLEEDTSFLDAGIVDSTGILELVSFLESRFGIRVEDEELVPENLNTLSGISSFLARKINGRAT